MIWNDSRVIGGKPTVTDGFPLKNASNATTYYIKRIHFDRDDVIDDVIVKLVVTDENGVCQTIDVHRHVHYSIYQAEMITESTSSTCLAHNQP